MPFNFELIDGIQVVLEKGVSNKLVGILKFFDGEFQFEYENDYLKSPSAIPLGPEMPLVRRQYQSKKLFRPFFERIPSRENPAYPEYCKAAGISADEKDPIILLAKIASRGPSSFLFKPIYHESFTKSDLKKFRKKLGLSIREFAHTFDFSHPGISRVETGKSEGGEILRRAEIYASYPEVALDQLKRRSAYLHRDKLEKAVTQIRNF